VVVASPLAKPTTARADLVGLSRLAIDAMFGLTDVVEAMHGTIARGPLPFGVPAERRSRGLTRFVYQNIRFVTRLVSVGLDRVLPLVARLAGQQDSSQRRDALVAALNGVVGDHLVATNNPLAIQMRCVPASPLVTIDQPISSRVLLVVHGLSMNAAQWQRRGHHHGEALARALGYSLVSLEYNTGRHISTNGRELAEKLAALVAGWPVPIDELAIVGHSMGGLVTRSACHYGRLAGHAWLQKLRAIAFLGTPHHGAPLERAGNLVEHLFELSPYASPIARLGHLRSAGITDLRFGNLLDEDWQERPRRHRDDPRTPVPLPDDVACYAIAARGGAATDGLVPVASALGSHEDARFALAFPPEHRRVIEGCDHLGLLDSPAVFEQLQAWMTGPSR